MSTKSKTVSAFTTTSALYAELKIEPSGSVHQQLELSASRIFDLGRRTAEQTFEMGDLLSSTAMLLPEGTFDKWVKRRCGLAARSARNYVAVFRNLTPFRDELVDVSAGSTVLFHLASATPEQVKEAIRFAEENERLQVADVRLILAGGEGGKSKAVGPDLHAMGGVAGLKAIIAAKVRDGAKAYISHITTICQAIEAALGKKRVIKEALAKEIQEVARIARAELESLALFIEPEVDLSRGARGTRFPKGSHWAAVHATLYDLGGVDAWPKSGEMRGWLETQVLPILNWAVATERKPEWPLEEGVAAAPVAPAASAGSVAELPDLVDAMDVSVEGNGEAEASAAAAADDAAMPGRSILPLEEALAKASGGAFAVTREAPKARTDVLNVPPLASDEAADEDAMEEETLAEHAVEDEAAAPAVMV
nr:hypothetical protein RKHAN_00333 [Rhizobium sp. Khangiran2]